MRDLKSAKLAGRIGPVHFFIANESADFRILDRFPKLFQFGLIAFGEQFNPTVRQVADHASEIKTAHDRFHCITKTDALHAPGIKNVQPFALHVHIACVAEAVICSAAM